MVRSIRNFSKRAFAVGLTQGQKDRMLRVLTPLARDQFDILAHYYARAPHMKLGLEKLAARGFVPKTIVDVGAFEGQWSQMVHEIWPDAAQVLIEANAEKKAILKPVADELDAVLEFALLGPEDGVETTFYVMESGSSVLPENSPLSREAKTIPTQRLDTLLNGRGADFLKLDVQGFELEVLNGAPETLKQANAVLLEVSLLEINAGAPIMSDVVAYMKAKGFEVLDILEIHHRPLDKATNQVDLLFAPAVSPLFSDTRHFA